jgi:hypothetical protein
MDELVQFCNSTSEALGFEIGTANQEKAGEQRMWQIDFGS